MAKGRWSERENDALVDLIYDAAVDDALWPDVLERLGDRAGAHPGNLLQIDVLDGSGFGIVARTPDDTVPRFFTDWTRRNPIGLVDDPFDYRRDWAPRILHDYDSVDRQVLERSPYWNEFLVPLGAFHSIHLRLALRGNDLTSIGLGRPAHAGAFTDAEIAALIPFHRHLIRAERLWRSLGLRQVEFDQFDRLLAASSDALFFLDDQLQLLRWTAPAETLLQDGRSLRCVGGRLRVADPAADLGLQRALASALRAGAPLPVTVPAARAADTLTLSVARLGERATIGAIPGRCLLVAARSPAPVDDVAALRARYGFTPAEAELALALRHGDALRDIADRRRVAIATVRNQLRAVFDKTGCHRQQDLVRLLATGG